MDTDDSASATKDARKSKSKHAAGSAAASSAASAAVNGSAALSTTHDTSSIGVDDELIEQLHAFATRSSNSPAAGSEEGSKMAGALSMGLCCQLNTELCWTPGNVPLLKLPPSSFFPPTQT